MSEEKKPFSDRRWTEPPAYNVIGHHEYTEEERAENHRKFMEFLRNRGRVKDETQDE